MSGFQSSVFLQQGFGVQGELFSAYPHRVQSFILVSGSAANNIIGQTCCTITSQGVAAAGGTGIFGGFLVDPKNYTNQGSGGIALAPNLVLPNYTQVELLTEGSIVVNLPAAAAIGDVVIFDQSTGAISTQAPTAVLASGFSFANAVVDYFTVTAAGLAVITVTPQQNPYVHQ